MDQLTLFDYGALDSETRIVVQQRTNEIKSLMRRAAQDIIDIGQKLIEVKAALGHGNFGAWLKAEFEWGITTAWKFMQAAETFSQCENMQQFAPSALYLLAAPSTPDAAREEALERAANGETITHQAARAIVAEHAAPQSPVVDALPFVPTAADYADFYGDEEPSARVVEPRESHQLINQSTNNEWYTPARFVDAARQAMGRIDLDPASCEYANQTVQATVYYTIDDDGYGQQWHGNVWLNPPYGRDDADGESNQARWSRKLLDEYRAGRVKQAVMLVNAVPGNLWFTPLKNFPICFPDGRIRFYNEDTDAGQPTHSNAIVYLGLNVAAFVAAFSPIGRVMGPLAVEDGHVCIAL